jgi:hypothetical protein
MNSIITTMKCSDLKTSFSNYLDDGLESRESVVQIEKHLSSCPLCRQEMDDLRKIRNGLRSIPRPEIPQNVLDSIRQRLALEASKGDRPGLFLPAWRKASYEVWLMSYSIGAFASVVLGFSFLWMILYANPAARRADIALYSSSTSTIATTANGDSVSPFEFVKTRADVTAESPSVNPRGTLIGLTEALVKGELKDDEVVVVADVYENGLAQITEVVEPSRDRKAVGELARALDTDPAYSPFVPAQLDQRSSDPVRVILKIQSVDVSINDERPRRRGRVSL